MHYGKYARASRLLRIIARRQLEAQLTGVIITLAQFTLGVARERAK